MQRMRVALVATGMVAVFVCVGQGVGKAQSGKSASPLIGVWRITGVTRTGPNSHNTANPQPGLFIVTAGHYAIDSVNSEASRAELPPADKRTDKQVAEAFGPFTAEAGTYEIKGDEITMKRIAAKNPAAMKAGNFVVMTFRLEGKDTLSLTQKSSDAGPTSNPNTFKLTRIE
jgi:hypothetical protein